MADSPYVTWYTSDFLNGVASADMNAEQIGVYAIILNLIGDSGGPIEDDPAWIGRRCNISTRRAGMIINELAAMPNKLIRRNGLIGNRRMMEEVAKRTKKGRQARDAANEKWRRWRAEHKPQLPLEEPGTGSLSRILPGDIPEIKREIKSQIKPDESQKTAKEAVRTHSGLARAGVIPESESENQTNDQSLLEGSRAPESSDRPIGPDRDLFALLNRVSEASGFRPVLPGAIAKAIDHVRQWRDDGIDFETVVIPIIESTMAKSTDETSSLQRFERRIRHEHARQQAQSKEPTVTPPEPLLEPPDEDPQFRPLRQALLRAMGPVNFAYRFNKVRFDTVNAGDKAVRPLQVTGFTHLTDQLMSGEISIVLRRIARDHGFTTLWPSQTRPKPKENANA